MMPCRAHNECVSASTPATTTGVIDGAWHVPGPELRPFIAAYSGFRYAGVEPMRHRGLPSPFLTLIFTLDEPLFLAAHADPLQPAGSYQTLVGGLHSAPALIVHDGWQSGVQLMLSPLGARALLGMPAGALAGIDVDGDLVLGPLASEIQDKLRSASDWPSRFAILDEVMLARVRACDERSGVNAEVCRAWTTLLRSGGNSSIASLAAETGWSDRHLRNRFLAEVGLAPKVAGRVIRFHVARRELARRAATGGMLGLADLAARYGYFDQAHLDREFRLMAGCPPTQWVAEEFRNIQAGGGHPQQEW
jgi:AraC-like DNA-binding protein